MEGGPVSALVLSMVLISAALHPLREFFIKDNASPEAMTIAVIVVFGFLSMSHVLVTGADPWSALQVWPLVLISAAGGAVYYLCVLKTLNRGDLSIYYPITRSSPLFIVSYGYVVLDQAYSTTLLLGIGIVLGAAFMIQYRRGASLFNQPGTLGLAALAMCAHGVITLADAKAVQTVEPMAFLVLAYPLQLPFIIAALVITRPKGTPFIAPLLAGWRATPMRFLFVGSLSYVSYYLILHTFQIGADVAVVSSVLQISIPVSVLLGCLLLKEEKMAGRMAWSALMALGIAVIMIEK